MATTTTSLGTLIESALTIIKDDTVKTGLPVILSFLQNIQANPSEINIVAQVNALEVNLLAALPNLEMAVVKDLATLLQAQLTTLAGTITAPAPAPAA